jgi:hypothetical protein
MGPGQAELLLQADPSPFSREVGSASSSGQG